MLKVGERIKARREASRLTQAALANAVGVSANAVYRWEAGLDKPTGENFSKIAAACGVNLQWLITGEGEPRRAATLDLVHKLSVKQEFKEAMREVVREELHPQPAPAARRHYELPILGKIAANYVPTAVATQERLNLDELFNPATHYGVKVIGRSMWPTAVEGDVCIVEAVQIILEEYDEMKGPADKRAWDRLSGEIVCAVVDDEDAVLKRLRIAKSREIGFQIILAGDNPASEQIVIQKENRLRIVGIVRSILRNPKAQL